MRIEYVYLILTGLAVCYCTVAVFLIHVMRGAKQLARGVAVTALALMVELVFFFRAESAFNRAYPCENCAVGASLIVHLLLRNPAFWLGTVIVMGAVGALSCVLTRTQSVTP